MRVALMLAALPACVIQTTTHRERDSLSFDEPVDIVEVDLGAGDLTLRTGGDAVVVERAFSYSGQRPDAEARVEGGVLFLDVECDALRWTCSVDHTVTLPAGADLVGDLGSGDVDVEGLVGDVDLVTGSGDVAVRSVVGDVMLTTGSGDVDVSLLEAPSLVVIETGSGDVWVEVPAGAYRIRTHTGSGDVVTDGLVSDPGAAAVIDVSTGSGDVTLIGR